MNTIAYLRRSAKPNKEEQSRDDQSASIEQQAAAIARYCKQTGLAVVDAVAHDGVSGGRRQRFTDLWAAVEKHHAGAIVTYHIDRLGRDLAHLLEFRKRCDRAGIAIHVVGQGKLEPVKSSNGFINMAVHGLVAEHYRLVIGEKTKDALARRRTQGRRWWGGSRPPYGWRAGEDGWVTAEPGEQAALDALRTLVSAQAGFSVRDLGRMLAKQGIVARNGHPFAPSTLWRLCRRPRPESFFPPPPGGESQGQPAEEEPAEQPI